MFNKYIIEAKNETENNLIHSLFIQLGYKLDPTLSEFDRTPFVVACADGSLGNVINSIDIEYQGITLSQLQDLVVLHRNDISDATHYQTEYPDSRFYLSSCRHVYMFDNGDWISSGIYPKELTLLNDKKEETMNIEYIHGETVDGKTAFNAWYDGETVLVKYYMNDWKEFDPQDGYSIEVFKSKNHQFMIKPKTIMIGDVKVPAPFQPKDGEKYWHISTDEAKGYWWNNELDQYAQFGAWRTEEEIKQVVEALRKYLTVK